MNKMSINKDNFEDQKQYMRPNTIFVKTNGNTIEIPLHLTIRPSLVSDNSFIGKKYAVSELEIIDENETGRCVNGLLYAINNTKGYNIKQFVKDLESIDFNSQNDDLKPYFDKLLISYQNSENYSNSTNYSLNKLFLKHHNLLYSTLIKQAIIYECNSIYDTLPKKIKQDLILTLSMHDQNKIIDYVKSLAHLQDSITSNDQGNYIKSLENYAMIDCINIYRFNEFNKDEKRHLCWMCILPESCEKIHPMYKANIDEYNDITDGIQISDCEGLSNQFLISKCKKYSKSCK